MKFPEASGERPDSLLVPGRELDTYRVLLALAVVLTPIFGLVYQLTNLAFYDPLWARLTFASIPLILLVASYVSAYVRTALPKLFRGFIYLLTTWFAGLAAVNSYSPGYAIGLLYVVSVGGIAFIVGLRRTRPLVYYVLFTLLLLVSTPVLASGLTATDTLLITCLAGYMVIFCPVAMWKIRSHRKHERTNVRYHELLRASRDAIFVLARDLTIVEANRAAHDMYERGDESLAQTPFEHLISREVVGHELRELIDQNHAIAHREVEMRNRTGGRIPCSISISPLETDADEPKLFLVIARDMGEHKYLERQLLNDRREKEQQVVVQIREHLAQILSGVKLMSKSLAEQLERRGLSLADEASLIKEHIHEADAMIERLIRKILPVDPDPRGLVHALRRLASNIEQKFGVPCDIHENDQIRIDDPVAATQIYRSVYHALVTGVIHEHATHVSVSVAVEDAQLLLNISLHGHRIETASEDPFPYRLIEHSTRKLGGTLTIDRSRPSDTTLTCYFPADLSSANGDVPATPHEATVDEDDRGTAGRTRDQ